MYIVMYKGNVQIIYSVLKIDCFIMWAINMNDMRLPKKPQSSLKLET